MEWRKYKKKKHRNRVCWLMTYDLETGNTMMKKMNIFSKKPKPKGSFDHSLSSSLLFLPPPFNFAWTLFLLTPPLPIHAEVLRESKREMANATRGNVIFSLHHYYIYIFMYLFMYSTGIEKEIGALQLEVRFLNLLLQLIITIYVNFSCVLWLGKEASCWDKENCQDGKWGFKHDSSILFLCDLGSVWINNACQYNKDKIKSNCFLISYKLFS